MARGPGLVDDQEQRVAVAVQPHLVHLLDVAGRVALHPVLPPRPGPVRGAAGGEGAVQRLVVHPRDHQHLAGAALLGDRAHEAVGVALEPRGDGRIEGHLTSTSAARRLALTSAIRKCPKWNTVAARTASAPAATAGAKSSTRPAPPDAITGTSTAARTAAIMHRSKPSRVPSASIELSRISPTPSSWPRAAHSTASIPVPWRPPCVVTSHPDGVGGSPTARCGRRPTARCTAPRTDGWLRAAAWGAGSQRC